jgi:putative membrane protein
MRIHGQITRGILVLAAGSAIAIAQTTGGSTGAAGSQSGAAGSAQGSGSGAAASTQGDGAGAAGSTQGGGAGHAGHGQGQHSADHGMSANKGAGMMVGPADQQFMIKAAQGGLMEVEVARLAQEKASSNEVKEYARKLEQDHQKANEMLKQLASQKNVELPTDMGKHRQHVDKLRNVSGDKFDQQFMKMQVQHHRMDVNEFQKHTNRAMDSDVRNFASTNLPVLQEHLRQAQDLQGTTRGRSSNTGRTNAGSTSGNNAGSTSGDHANHGAGATTGGASNQGDSSARPQGDNNPTTTK